MQNGNNVESTRLEVSFHELRQLHYRKFGSHAYSESILSKVYEKRYQTDLQLSN